LAAACELHMSLIQAFEVVNQQTVLLVLLFLSDSQSQRTGIICANQGYPWSLLSASSRFRESLSACTDAAARLKLRSCEDDDPPKFRIAWYGGARPKASGIDDEVCFLRLLLRRQFGAPPRTYCTEHLIRSGRVC